MQVAIEPECQKKTRRPRKTEFRVDELPEDVRQAVIDEYRDCNVDYEEWSESSIEDFKKKAENAGFDIRTRTEEGFKGKTYQKPAIYWSGFSSQGDGASFEADIDLNKYIRAHAEDLIKAGIDIFTLRKIINNEPSQGDWELNPFL
ncbi:MAG: hypothetical protein A3K30_05445 [Deltaproteobacteria bacterium RBG_13_51_10]|nr:MAG: hypothetical protein A3K30_05445 [Deltaproteobacteria bacterium RBG_13_51_10]